MGTRYRISKTDYVRATKLATRLSLRGWLLCALVGLAAGIGNLLVSHPVADLLTSGLLGAVVAVPLFNLILAPALAVWHYRRYKVIQQPVEISQSADGVAFAGQSGSANLFWGTILKWRAGPECLLIFVMPRLYYIVPTRVAADGFDLALLLQRLRSEVGDPS